MPNDEYGTIGPEDLENLRLIIQMFSQGDESYTGQQGRKYASLLAESIREQPAREIADFLVEHGTEPNPVIRKYAETLRSETLETMRRRLVAS